MPKITPLPHQIRILSELEDNFDKYDRGILCASCSTGKTFMSFILMNKVIKVNQRVAISAFSQSDMREQWSSSILKSALFKKSDIQIVVPEKDVSSFKAQGYPAVSCTTASSDTLITIFIPQTLKNCAGAVGKFDFFIIDEAHDFLDVNNNKTDGMLKKILKVTTHKKTKILGLTGTGFEIMREGGFFEDTDNSFNIIYDSPSALRENVIMDCDVYCVWFDIDLGKGRGFYNNENINGKGAKYIRDKFKLSSKGKKVLKHKSVQTIKLEGVIKDLEGKTLIITTAKNSASITASINNFFGKTVAVEKTSYLTKSVREDNENEFRHNPNIKFMVVINMCNVGWDFPELQNVVDLSFTKNPKLIIQSMSRVIRKHKLKKIPKYIYCADQSKSEMVVRWYLGNAMELTTKRGILNYDGSVYIPSKKMLERGELNGEIPIFRTSDYYDDYDKLFNSVDNKTIFRKKLSEIEGDPNNKWFAVTDLLYKIYEDMDDKEIRKATDECTKIKNKEVDEQRAFIKCLTYLQEYYPEQYVSVHGNYEPKYIYHAAQK